MTELATCVTYGRLNCAFVYHSPNRPTGPDLIISHALRRFLATVVIGEVAAPAATAAVVAVDAGVEGAVFAFPVDLPSSPFVGPASGFVELCRRCCCAFPCVRLLFNDETLVPGRRPASETRSATARRIGVRWRLTFRRVCNECGSCVAMIMVRAYLNV